MRREDTVPIVGWLPFIPTGASTPCMETDPEIFFPPPGNTPMHRDAVKVCLSCELRLDCLSYVLNYDATHGGYTEGIWGGTSLHDRYSMISRMRREDSWQSQAGA